MFGYGLVYDDDPFVKYQAMKRFRLENKLTVIDGPIELEDLRCEDVRKAVYNAYYSVRNDKVVSNPCHFGMINHPQFEVIVLIATNQLYDVEIVANCEYVNGEIRSSYVPKDIPQVLMVVGEASKGNLQVEEVISLDEPLETFDINEPKIKERFGYENVMIAEGDEVYEFKVTKVYKKKTVPGRSYNFIRLPLHRYIDLINNDTQVGNTSVDILLEGAVFKDGKDRLVEFNDCISSHRSYVVHASSREVRVRVHIHSYVDVMFKKVIHQSYVAKNNRFRRIVEAELRRLKCKLEELPRTRLVNRNVAVIDSHVYGCVMPSPDLINQSYVMVGEVSNCAKGYDYKRERYQPCSKFADWSFFVHRAFEKRKKFYKMTDVFNEFTYYSSRYEKNLYPTEYGEADTVDWQNMEVYLSYEDYLDRLT